MEATYEQERVGDYIQTYTGRRFYPLSPKAEDFSLIDIAHALSNICRFTGHGTRFYSVAEHSILCARLARKLGFTPLQQLYCLGHDASEAVMNDLARPIKQNVPQYKELEDKIMSTMWDVMRIPQPTKRSYERVKLIDNTMLYHEITQLMNDKYYAPDYNIVTMYLNLENGYGAGEAKDDFLILYEKLYFEYLEGSNWKAWKKESELLMR